MTLIDTHPLPTVAQLFDRVGSPTRENCMEVHQLAVQLKGEPPKTYPELVIYVLDCLFGTSPTAGQSRLAAARFIKDAQTPTIAFVRLKILSYALEKSTADITFTAAHDELNETLLNAAKARNVPEGCLVGAVGLMKHEVDLLESKGWQAIGG